MSASPAASDAASPSAQPDEEVHSESGIGAPSGAGEATQALYNQVFGDGSDVSDLSDSEDERPAQRGTARRAFPPRGAATETQDRDEDVDEDNVDEDKDEEDTYVPGSAATVAKIPKFKKKAAGDDADRDDDDDAPVQPRKKKSKSEKKRRRERQKSDGGDRDDDQPAEPIYDEATQRRMNLEARIDNIGKKPKVTRRKKKGDDDVDIVDSYHDEICVRLKERMIAAADKDEESNSKKLPATAKLAMLDEVMGVLRNQTLWQSLFDNEVLIAVGRWLAPMEGSAALPAVGIQKSIFEVLPKMDLDTQTLKESRLGPVVLFYTKSKRVTPAINRQADALVQAWSRPIIKRPSNFRSKHVETLSEAVETQRRERMDVDGEGDEDAFEERQAAAYAAPRKKKRFDVRAALQENEGRKGARLYLNKDIQYTVAPESQTQHNRENMSHVSRIQMDNKKFNKFARTMKARK